MAWPWWRRTTAGSTTRAPGRSRAPGGQPNAATRSSALFHHHILGFVALTTGAWEEADAHLTTAAAIADQMAVRHPGRFKLAGDLVEAALALGDVDRAQAVVERLDEAARVAPTPWVVAVGLRSAALVAAARGDMDEAVDLLTAAVEAHDRLPMPFERGRTLLAKGRIHRRRKEKRLADETLHEALACFESLGAPDWVAITRAELGRVGRRPHAPTELTDTEQRVAELAATGLTTREIAERAFIAPKTVGNVLGRVYEKLGIHSRAELGALMATGSNASPPKTDRGNRPLRSRVPPPIVGTWTERAILMRSRPSSSSATGRASTSSRSSPPSLASRRRRAR